jgi:hypothetical protein
VRLGGDGQMQFSRHACPVDTPRLLPPFCPPP